MQEPTDAWERLRERIWADFMRQEVTYEMFTAQMTIIAAYAAWKEAAGAYGVLDGQQCQWDANGQDGCEGRQEDCQSPACRGWRNWKSEYDTRSAALVRLVEGE